MISFFLIRRPPTLFRAFSDVIQFLLPAIRGGLCRTLFPVCIGQRADKGDTMPRTVGKQAASRSVGWWVGSHPRLSAGVCPGPGLSL